MRFDRYFIVLLFALSISGCASLMSSVTASLADDLAATILNSNDVDTVREGIPAYILMIDSFLRSSPDNPQLLLTAADLNGAFSVFTEGDRAGLLTTKALSYAAKAGCLKTDGLCDIRTRAFDEYQQAVDGLATEHIAVAYAIGVAWTGWIQAHSDDWNAIAELARVKYLMSRVIELDETFDGGGPHLYMGGLETILPKAMGGNPDKGRDHFEKSLAFSNGEFLMTKVIYAEQYARLVFDQALHDRLLQEVLAADATIEGMTLTNTFAKQRAQSLLTDSNDYF